MSLDIETRVRQANPLTRDDQLEQLFGEDASRRLLRAIHDWREGRMTEQTQDEQTPRVVPDADEAQLTRRLRTRINPAIAIAAFLVVIAAGIALALAFRADEPDVVSPQSLAASYLEARDARDAGTALALLAPDAVVDDVGVTLEDQAGLLAWFEVIDHRWDVEACNAVDAGPPALVTCTYTHHNAWTQVLGIPPIADSADFTIERGQIVAMTVPISDDFGPVWSEMESWIVLNPDYDQYVMFNPGRTSALFTPESIALWRQATEEFVAEQEAGG